MRNGGYEGSHTRGARNALRLVPKTIYGSCGECNAADVQISYRGFENSDGGYENSYTRGANNALRLVPNMTSGSCGRHNAAMYKLAAAVSKVATAVTKIATPGAQITRGGWFRK